MNRVDRTSLEQDLAREEARLRDVEALYQRAQSRVESLRRQVNECREPAPKLLPVLRPRNSSEKIALFRTLFRGRTDVYPTRWRNARKGTSGYAPACRNEWIPEVCEKPRIKCGECPNQAFLPVRDQVILDHLRGRIVAGVYPLLEDDTCWFLAIDFDKGTWEKDVSALIETCREMHLPIAVERSRSGNGAHVWFFFREPVEARTARQFACHLITETMARRHELPMASYDRLFPNQDTLSRGGFGNLIALPFQNEVRLKGNSVFVDEAWAPYEDQWGFLAGLRRLDRAEVEAIAREALRKGAVLGVRLAEPEDQDSDAAPWLRTPSRRNTRPVIGAPLPETVRATLAQAVFVEKAALPSPLLNQIKRIAAFQNPEFYKKQALRFSTALTPRVVSCVDDLAQHIALPRGCHEEVKKLLADYRIDLVTDDQRVSGSPLKVDFHGELGPEQKRAAKAMAANDIGVFVAPPASGKTVVAAYLIAKRRRSTLVLVHRAPLLEQWIAQLCTFLDLRPKDIGRIGSGARRANGNLDVAMIQSLSRRGDVDEIVASYGQVIVDECHHVPAVSFERVMREVKARYVLGLTATPHRRDGLEPILQFQLGPVRFAISGKTEAEGRAFERRLVVRETAFRLARASPDATIQDIYRELAKDETRNRLILSDVVASLREGRSPIVLTERRDHLEFLDRELGSAAENRVVLRGGMTTKARRLAMERLSAFPKAEPRLVLATGRFVGEGFDDARLDTLFLALPVSWRGTLVQYAGRLHRRTRGKTEVRIVDYVDRAVPMLARMFEKRKRGYKAMGYVADDGAPSLRWS